MILVSLRILWATPLIQRSAIGRMSRDVCETLSRAGHDVVIARTETIAYAAAPTHATTLPVTSARAMADPAARDGFDAVVINIGNHHGFHAGIFPLLGADRSIGVFHDVYLVDLVLGELIHAGHGQHAIAGVIGEADRLGNGVAHDGPSPEALAGCIRSGRDLALVARHAPLIEWFAARVDAAVAHGAHYRGRLANACPGPTRVIPLAYAPPGVADLPLLPREGRGGVMRVLTLGWIGQNKCCDRVIEAIGSRDDLRAGAHYCLAGPIEPSERARLQALAASRGVRLDVLGEVDDATLLAELDMADVVCCLRMPILEGASASAIEAMLAARPVVVCDAGFYAELPDEVVVKVPADVPVDALARALGRLVSDPSMRRLLGERARSHAATHDPSRYAEAIVNMAGGIGARSTPLLALRKVVEATLTELSVDPSGSLAGSVMAHVAALGKAGSTHHASVSSRPR